MTGYTITITPDESPTAAQTTIRVDTATGAALITELTVRAVEGTGLAPHQLLDLAALISTLTPPTIPALGASPVAAQPAGVTPPEQPAEPAPRRSRRTSRSAKKTTQPGGTTSAASGGRGTKSTRTQRGAGTTARRAAASEPSANGRRRRSRAAEEPTVRAYRRMPDAAEVVAAYHEATSVKALADHFGVPRHTATAWIRRLRALGHLPAAA